jgi:hypothetical protein
LWTGGTPRTSTTASHRPRDDYACFDDDKLLRVFQIRTMAADPVLTRARFHALLQTLLPLLPAVNDGELAEVEHRGRAWCSIRSVITNATTCG